MKSTALDLCLCSSWPSTFAAIQQELLGFFKPLLWLHVPAMQCKKTLHNGVLSTLQSCNALNLPKSFSIWEGRGKKRGCCGEHEGPFSPWWYQRHLYLHCRRPTKFWFGKAEVPALVPTDSIPVIIIKYKSKHRKSFCLLERGARSFGCLLQALCTCCPMNS